MAKAKPAIRITIKDPSGREMTFTSITDAWIKTGISFTTLRRMLEGKECPRFPGWSAKVEQ